MAKATYLRKETGMMVILVEDLRGPVFDTGEYYNKEPGHCFERGDGNATRRSSG